MHVSDFAGLVVMEGTLRAAHLKAGSRVDTTVWSRLPSDPKVVEDEGAGAYVQG